MSQCYFLLLFILREIVLHSKFEPSSDSRTGEIFCVVEALELILGLILFPDEADDGVHTDHMDPGFFHGQLLLSLEEHGHQALFALAILVPVAQLLYGLHVLLCDDFLLLLRGLRHLVVLDCFAHQVLLLDLILPLFNRTGMLREEILLHVFSFSFFPHSLSSFDNLLPKVLVILFSSLFNHCLEVSVVLLVLLEVIDHFWLRRHGRCVDTRVAQVKLLLVF